MKPLIYFIQDYDDSPVFYSSIEDIAKNENPRDFYEVYSADKVELVDLEQSKSRGLVEEFCISKHESEEKAKSIIELRNRYFPNFVGATGSFPDCNSSFDDLVDKYSKEVRYRWIQK